MTLPGLKVSPSGLVRASELARYLDVTAQTLANWRAAGKPPKSLKLNGGFFYRVADIDAYINQSNENE
jgi:hypothetical protein